MTNEERIVALRLARLSAFNHAKHAEARQASNEGTAWEDHARLAAMWATVANALKVGTPEADGINGIADRPTWKDVETR